jgi:hypothetical protein
MHKNQNGVQIFMLQGFRAIKSAKLNSKKGHAILKNSP